MASTSVAGNTQDGRINEQQSIHQQMGLKLTKHKLHADLHRQLILGVDETIIIMWLD